MAKVKRTKLTDYTPDPENANQGTERGLRVLDESLSEFGVGRSVLADKNGVFIAGNKTAERAADLGITDVIEVETDGRQIVVVKRTDLDLLNDPEHKARGLAYADNRVGELDLTWDGARLLADMRAGVDSIASMFDPKEIEALVKAAAGRQAQEDAEAADPPPDRAALLADKWATARDQLWKVGPHRILCGDSKDPENVARILDGERPDILHGDPPYGISLLSKTASLGKSQAYSPVEGDDQDFDPEPFLKLAPVTILWGANHYANRLPPSPFWLVWDKQGGAKDTTFATCELAWCSESQPARILTHIWDGFRRDSEKGEERYHPTQKPVDVIRWALSWIKGKTILDPFLGSGSTVIAADQVGRVCYGIEIDPRYVAVTLERLSALGLTPELQSTL